MDSSIGQLVGLGATLSAIVGLVVWVVKMSFKRQSEITDRYFTHLETTQKRADATTEKLTGAFDELSGAMRSVEQRSHETANLIKELTKEVLDTRREITGSCRYQ